MGFLQFELKVHNWWFLHSANSMLFLRQMKFCTHQPKLANCFHLKSWIHCLLQLEAVRRTLNFVGAELISHLSDMHFVFWFLQNLKQTESKSNQFWRINSTVEAQLFIRQKFTEISSHGVNTSSPHRMKCRVSNSNLFYESIRTWETRRGIHFSRTETWSFLTKSSRILSRVQRQLNVF